MLTASCMAKPADNSTRMTWAIYDSKTPRQYIDSEFSPHLIIAIIKGLSGPCHSGGARRETASASDRKCSSRTGARWLL